MSELEDKLNTLLSDPDTMAQVMQLAQNLSGGPTKEAPPPPPSETPSANDLNALLSQFTGGLDPQLLARLVPLIGEINRPESGETAAFLRALRPFLREKRRDKVERVAQLAKLLHLAKLFLTTREG